MEYSFTPGSIEGEAIVLLEDLLNEFPNWSTTSHILSDAFRKLFPHFELTLKFEIWSYKNNTMK